MIITKNIDNSRLKFKLDVRGKILMRILIPLKNFELIRPFPRKTASDFGVISVQKTKYTNIETFSWKV